MTRSDVLHTLGQGVLVAAIFVAGRAVLRDAQDVAFTVVIGVVAACADLVRRRRASRRTP